MPKILKSAVAAAVLTAGVWCASVTPSYAKPKYAKTEGKACAYCHVTSGKPELNAAGDYYAAHDHSPNSLRTGVRRLIDREEPAAQFGIAFLESTHSSAG
jgi:hypothetical protein